MTICRQEEEKNRNDVFSRNGYSALCPKDKYRINQRKAHKEIKNIHAENDAVKNKQIKSALKDISQKYDVQNLFSLLFGSRDDLQKILELLGIKNEKFVHLFKMLSITKEKDFINGILFFINFNSKSKRLDFINLFLAFYSFFKGYEAITYIPVYCKNAQKPSQVKK